MVLVTPRVVIPETLSCCEVRLVADVTPRVVIPETLSCCAVKFVADVIPNVEIPETLSWEKEPAAPTKLFPTLKLDAVTTPVKYPSPTT